MMMLTEKPPSSTIEKSDIYIETASFGYARKVKKDRESVYS
jgi:hypothetical protein